MRWLISILLLITISSRGFCTPATAIKSAAEFARKNPTIMPYTRFFDLSCYPENYREEILKVLSFQLNSISTEPEMAIPKVVSAEVVAVNLLEYASDDEKGKNRFRDVWEKLADVDPYFRYNRKEFWPGGFDKRFNKEFNKGNYVISKSVVPYGGNPDDLYDLKALTHSNIPIVRADFWLAQVARQVNLANQQTGVGYFDWLGLKKRDDFEKLVAFREKDSLAIRKEIRAAVKDSGVSQNNRQIIRLQSLTGGYWITLDPKSSVGDQNAIERPDRNDGFRHDAEEIYGVLPNGLFAYWIGTDVGVRQDSAPDFIGPDDSPLRSGRDGRIHINLACVRCHQSGLKDINDWFRSTMRQPLQFQTPDYKRYLSIKRQYFSNLDNALQLDRAVYSSALKSCNGLSAPDNAKAFAAAWDWYAVEGVTVEKAAREIGISPEHLIKSLKDYAAKTGQLDLILSSFLANPPETIRRDHWEEVYPLVTGFLTK